MAAIKGQPSFHILISLIEIWTPNSIKNPMARPNNDSVIRIAECEEIVISKSYKQLVSTANVRFPRGTVIKRTRTVVNKDEFDPKISVDTSDHGIVYETRLDSRKAMLSDFRIGDRITIMLGYTEDPKIADLAKANKSSSIFNDIDKYNIYKSKLHTVFEGYIERVSLDTPIELECGDLASSLKRFSCPRIQLKSTTVNALLSGEKGCYNLLEDTGLALDAETAKCKIPISHVSLTDDQVVSDELLRWNSLGLYPFVQFVNNKPVLTVRRAYFSNPGGDSILSANQRNRNKSQPIVIDFGYHVSDNDLSLMDTDKDFMVVEASGVDKDNTTLRVTVRLNPNWEKGMPESDKYQFLNEKKESKKQQKKKKKKKSGGTTKKPRKPKWKLKEYTVIKFVSQKATTTSADLRKEAVQYFEHYNMNGIEGSLTLFGDLNIEPADQVRLFDERQPGKNGVYIVEEVVTKFGNGGYRQTIKMPYCLSRNSNQTTITE